MVKVINEIRVISHLCYIVNYSSIFLHVYLVVNCHKMETKTQMKVEMFYKKR